MVYSIVSSIVYSIVYSMAKICNSKGFGYMLLYRQYFTDISDYRVAFMTQNVSYYQRLCM